MLLTYQVQKRTNKASNQIELSLKIWMDTYQVTKLLNDYFFLYNMNCHLQKQKFKLDAKYLDAKITQTFSIFFAAKIKG